jgi:hypothetical protein
MTVDQYLDLAYAVVVEDRVRRGMNLHDALEATKEFAAGTPEPVPTASGSNTTSTPPRPPANVEAQNDASLQQLQAMMGGLGGGFR